MKKQFAALLCFLVVALSFGASVLAEPENPGETTTSTTATTTTEATDTEGTEPSETGTTETDPPAGYEFSFSYQGDTLLTISYTPSLPLITGYRVFDGTVTLNRPSNPFTVNISNQTTPGQYPIVFYTEDGRTISCDKMVEIRNPAGNTNTALTLSVSGRRVTGTLKDEFGNTVPGASVIFYVDGAQESTKKTDKSGQVSFTYTGSPESVRLFFAGFSTATDRLTYNGCDKAYSFTSGSTGDTTRAPSTTRAPRPETTKTIPVGNTLPEETEKTFPLVFSSGTTSYEGNKLILNSVYDSNLLKLFNRKESIFSTHARLLVNKEVIANTASGSSVPMMQAVTSPLVIKDAAISSATHGISDLSIYNAEDTLRIVMDLSLVLANVSTKTVQPLDDVDLSDAEMEIELPVPAGMQDSKQYKIVAAYVTEDGDGNVSLQLSGATVKDDVVRFEAAAMGTFALLGFKTPDGYTPENTLPVVVIVIFVAGILMLLAAGFLLYFFFLRKTAVPADGPWDAGPPDDGPGGNGPAGSDYTDDDVNLYSSSTRGADSSAAPPPGSVSLGALSEPDEDDLY